VIERHRKRLRDGQLSLDRPRQKMREVLGVRADHLGAEQALRRDVGIDV
jgi:hypothetical protein